MEIYTNSKAADRTVFLPFPDPVESIDVELWQDNEKLYEFATAAATPDEGYSVTLPLRFIQHDAELKVHWAIRYNEDSWFHDINRVTPVEVTTPILSKAEIRAIDPYVFSDDAEVVKIEKAVRHIIQAYTGQEFGHYVGTEIVKGSESKALFSPRRILELHSVNGVVAPTRYIVDSEGFTVRHYPLGVPPVKADFHGLHYHTGGVIHDPNNVRWAFFSDRTYELAGRFGYEEVPSQVKEAAKLLVNDYACADAQYRDRYLTSMTAADWRIQFYSGAFLRTGNVRADQLLSEYVVTRGWGII